MQSPNCVQVSAKKECKDDNCDLQYDTGQRTSLGDFELLLVLGKGSYGKARIFKQHLLESVKEWSM